MGAITFDEVSSSTRSGNFRLGVKTKEGYCEGIRVYEATSNAFAGESSLRKWRKAFSKEEEDLIIELHAVFGGRWSEIAAQLRAGTDDEIKNFWNSSHKKKLRQREIDPTTHKPLPVKSVLECNGSSLFVHA